MADTGRLLTDATGAFVDRTRIDWTALLARADASDRTSVESLRLLDEIRRQSSRDQRATERSGPETWLVRPVLALAAAMTTLSLTVAGAGAFRAGAFPGRPAPLVLAVAFAGAGVFLTATGSRDPRQVFLLAALVTTGAAFARATAGGLLEAWPWGVGRVLLGIVPEAFTPACLWQFALHFPRVSRFTVFDVMARRATVAAWLVGALFFAVNLAAAAGVRVGELAPLVRNAPGHLFWDVFALALVWPVGAILVRARRAVPLERRKVLRLAMVMAVGATPFVLSSLARQAVPGVEDWLHTAPTRDRLWLDIIIVAALALIPILGSVAVAVDRPFEIRAVFGHRALKVLAHGLVTAVVIAPLAAVAMTLYGRRHLPVTAIIDAAWPQLVFWAVAGAILFLTRAHMLGVIDRRVLDQSTDRDERLTRALGQIRLARGRREIAAVLEAELRTALAVDSAGVLVLQPDGDFSTTSADMRLGSATGLVALLRQTTTPLDLSIDGTLCSLLPSQEREWVRRHRVRAMSPIVRLDGILSAVVVLGSNLTGVRLSERDRWLLTTLVTAAATAWDGDATSSGPRASADDWPEHHDDRREAAYECPACGVVSQSPSLSCGCDVGASLASLPYQVGGKFTVQRRIGAGAMGVVYLARDTTLGRDVALKTLPRLGISGVRRLRDEARAMAALNHAALATLYGLEVWRQTPVLVVEYFARGTLAHRLALGPLAAEEVIRIGCALAAALSSMHTSGVLHRDLKPRNIALTATGAPKLLDFGLATWVDRASNDLRPHGHAGFDAPAGTPAYLPPEAHAGAAGAAAFDLWALAVVILEATTGRHPFLADDRATTARRVVALELGDALSSVRAAHPGLAACLERALSRRPELRFQTADDMQAALNALIGSERP